MNAETKTCALIAVSMRNKCVRACVRIAFVFLMLQFVLALLVTRGGSSLATSKSSFSLSLSLGVLGTRDGFTQVFSFWVAFLLSTSSLGGLEK